MSEQGACPYAGKWYSIPDPNNPQHPDILFVLGWYGTWYTHSVTGKYADDRKYDMGRVRDVMDLTGATELSHEDVRELGFSPTKFSGE